MKQRVLVARMMLPGRELVQTADIEARSAGIQGVPVFIFNRKVGVSGVQKPEALLQSVGKDSGHTIRRPQVDCAAPYICAQRHRRRARIHRAVGGGCVRCSAR